MILLKNTLNQNLTKESVVENSTEILSLPDYFPSETLTFASDKFFPDTEIDKIFSRDDVKSLLESIPDSFAREATRLHLRYCPFTSLCNFSLGPVSATFTRQCCFPCSCNSSCEITGNCCPNYKSDQYLGNIKRDNYQGNCQHAAFVDESHPFLQGERYYFVSECPISAEETRADACINPKRPATLEEFSDIIPVTDTSRMINYKNRHCAACNKILASNITYWSIVLHCLVGVSADVDTIMQFIDKKQCNLLYKPDNILEYRPTVCTPMVTKCNLTGKWRNNSEIVERACTLNIGSVYQSNDGLYTNIYCMICNENEDDNSVNPACYPKLLKPPKYDEVDSFSALLNFMKDIKPLEKSTPCGEEKIFDPYENECRRMFCSSTRSLVNGECVNTFLGVKGAKFELVLGFNIEEPCLVYQASGLIDEMTAWFSKVLERSIPLTCVCSKEIIYKTDYNYSNTFMESESAAENFINLSTIEYIASRWIFKIKDYYSYKEIDAFVLNITNVIVRITVNKTEIYTVHPQLVYIEEEEFGVTPVSSKNLSVEFYHVIGDSKSEPLQFAYPSKRDNKTMIRSMVPNDNCSCPAVESLIRLPFDILPCTLIEIKKEEYEWSVMEHGVILPELNLHLNMTEFIITNESGNNIRICSEKYMTSFNEMSSDRRRHFSVQTILSVVCTGLSLICLFVTFIIYLRFPILQTVPGKNNIALIVNMIFAQIIYLIFVIAGTFSGWTCRLIGIFLHFFWLSAILWLNICTFHMFKVFVRLNKPNLNVSSSKPVVKYLLTVFTISCFFVLVNVIKGLADSDMAEIGYGSGICYISSGAMVGYTFALPVGFVVLSNLFMFLVVIQRVCSLPSIEKKVKNERNNVVIFAKLSSLTGITWIFGFLYQWTNEIILSYVFIVLNASLGVFIMISFVINSRVIRLAQGKSSDSSASIFSYSKREIYYTENSAC
ncbi:hypothetical protein CHS0354_041123 [Potamilus streckersoni]|uniref:G-protein coupled receptors family 2 profile 2 domain-containing protein n=1 Tax=Potamilus streckersoni TaxID=2493646 RepID=A0AAE0SEZ9_9BIVA|nr:hypothetical protein CHS0354_041123 [Potamilus streckersoni]